jgi:hypothetical protein
MGGGTVTESTVVFLSPTSGVLIFLMFLPWAVQTSGISGDIFVTDYDIGK